LYFDETDIKDLEILLPLELIDRRRNQWISDLILGWVLTTEKPRINTKILTIRNFDAYFYGLNFVLGQAYVNGKVAIICLPGIKEEFCGKRENN